MHVMSNPYSPPAAPPGYAPPNGYAWGGAAAQYVPLGTRAAFAIVGLVAACASSFALDAAQLAFAEDLSAAEPSLAASLAVAGAGLAVLGANVLAAVLFCVWLHRAAKNLP